MVFEEPVDALDNLQYHFLKICQARLDESGNSHLKVHKDAAYTENPMEREDLEESIKVIQLCPVNHQTSMDDNPLFCQLPIHMSLG